MRFYSTVVFCMLSLVAIGCTAQEMGFLSSWWTNGNYTVCEYTTSQGVFAVTIDVTEVCPTTIEIN